jgi:hypothetical protein
MAERTHTHFFSSIFQPHAPHQTHTTGPAHYYERL